MPVGVHYYTFSFVSGSQGHWVLVNNWLGVVVIISTLFYKGGAAAENDSRYTHWLPFYSQWHKTAAGRIW